MTLENTSNKKLSESNITISASEVHEFFYCPYAWWYLDTSQNHFEQLKQGQNYHTKFSLQQTPTRNRTLNWLLPTIAVVLAITATIFYFISNL